LIEYVLKKFQSIGCAKLFSVSSTSWSQSERLENFRERLANEEATLPPPPSVSSHFTQQSPPLAANMTRTISAPRRFHIESYGCQMNLSDTEIVRAILKKGGFEEANRSEQADVVLLNTCAIRENAEQRIWSKLEHLKHKKLKRQRNKHQHPLQVGILGCMAERLKEKILESDKLVDLVVGPDAYRSLPSLLSSIEDGADHQTAMNVLLSADETYADITPVRDANNQVSAFVSIMRGCNNMCAYCIVPFTRGRERSRLVSSIEDEVRLLRDQGYKEMVLLGQNVNSYNDLNTPATHKYANTPTQADGFRSIVKVPSGGTRFAELLDRISTLAPEMRIRFTSPHPKDFPDDVFHLAAERTNICNAFHMPAQSGSSNTLKAMRRGHTRQAYLALIERLREIVPNATISSDFISGFCGETEQDHQDTLSLLREVQFDQAFMFAYSLREKTHAHRKLQDDVPEQTKQRRLREVIDLFYSLLKQKNAALIGSEHIVLVDGPSKRSHQLMAGRSDTNHRVVFNNTYPQLESDNNTPIEKGEWIKAKIVQSNGPTLIGIPLYRTNIFGHQL